ncbi:MAG TPA: ABC transporter ATP-binding protein, partial [Deinococcales bacterium]|nr:ABC transporter ATP-binding protein [Deinococcales bacterium]
PGEVVAMLGPNGAGKTTAISLMLGTRRPTSGEARIYGRDPRDPEARARVGAMLQESGVPGTLKVREIIDWFTRLYPNPMPVARVLELSDLTSKSEALAATLSGGQKQRLYFALAVCGNPEVLFLDEPSVALDVETRREFWEQIGALAVGGKTIILTTHYLEEADALANRIVVINKGRLVAAGSPEEIKARVGGKQLRFTLPGASEGFLLGISGVDRCSVVNQNVSIYTLQPEVVLKDLFARNLNVRDLEVTGAGLEEAFVSITSEDVVAAD